MIVDSNITGLTTTLHITKHSSLHIILITKNILAASSTHWAQNNITAALNAKNSPEDHFTNTIVANAKIYDQTTIQILVHKKPAAIRELTQINTQFNHTHNNALSLTQKNKHHRDRITHTDENTTNTKIEQALVTRVLNTTNVKIIEHTLILNLLHDITNAATNITLHVINKKQRNNINAIKTRTIMLATNGINQIYTSTTNPNVSTSDNMTATLQTNTVIQNIKFVQFHPTIT